MPISTFPFGTTGTAYNRSFLHAIPFKRIENDMNAIKDLIKDDNGATLVEYGIIVALIAVVCIGIVATLGKTIAAQFTTINSDL